MRESLFTNQRSFIRLLVLILVQETSLEIDSLLEMKLKEFPSRNLQCYVTSKVTILYKV